MSVAILRQGDYLVASIQSDLSDSEVLALRDELRERVGRQRSRGIIIDVTALDVIDSFVARSLRAIAVTARLRGAETIIVGIQPEVAIAMVHFDLNLEPLRTALDLDEALGLLELARGKRSWRMRSACRSPATATSSLRARTPVRSRCELGFSRTDATLITTALSEIARNIVVHAGRGEIVMAPVYDGDRFGLQVVARDRARGSATSTARSRTGTRLGADSASACLERAA